MTRKCILLLVIALMVVLPVPAERVYAAELTGTESVTEDAEPEEVQLQVDESVLLSEPLLVDRWQYEIMQRMDEQLMLDWIIVFLLSISIFLNIRQRNK